MKGRTGLTPDQRRALEILKERLDARFLTHINTCVRCGLCADSCHYYLADGNTRYTPAFKVERVAQIYRRYHTLLGRILPRWIGAKNLDEETVKEMTDVIFGACTMCGRCTLHCSTGVDIPHLIRTARTMLVELGMVPEGLQSTVDTAIRTGNNMGIPREELVDTLKWLEEDLQLEVGDPDAAIPLEKRGAGVMYTLNPREPKFFPLSISATAKIFYAAGEDWTISPDLYDVTNYAWYSGDDEAGRELVRRIHDKAVELEAETLVLAECGHGFRAIRWEGPRWLGKPYPFEARSLLEITAGYLRSGRIELDPDLNTEEPVTLHDPCNLVRAGGVIEQQRYLLRNSTKNFVEMTPNRADNYCCGGGGGQLSMSEYRDRRVDAGRIKAEQIRRSGARIVATPCHNCIDQLMELSLVYELGVQIKTVAEIVADSLVLPDRNQAQEG